MTSTIPLRVSAPSAAPIDYPARGRLAVGAFFRSRTGSEDVRDHAAVIADRRVAAVVVRLWAIDDLFPHAEVELAARAAYPELGAEFADLDAGRRRARQELHLARARAEVDAAFGEDDDPDGGFA